MPPTLPPGLTLRGSTTTSPRGRSIAASRAFGPGATIASFGDPTCSIAITDSAQLSQTCNYCLSVTAGVRACAGCRTAAYCTPACQKADWARVHRHECKVFRRVRAEGRHEVLPTPVRALVQVLLRADVRAAMADLEGHVELVHGADPKAMADIELQAMAALHYMDREASARNMAEAVEISCKLRVNSFNRLDVDVGQTGIFVNPALAMVNHSCVPNAFVQFVERAAVLHAYQEIKEGEEIEISYIENTLHRSHRQKALKTRYHFDCSCPRCKDDLDVYQVCQRYPHLELNLFSLTPDLKRLRNPPVKQSTHTDELIRREVEELYPSCSGLLQGLTSEEQLKALKQWWKACAQLRKAELYAVEPLNHVLVEACVYFSKNGNFACSLAISCFLALNSDPYTSPMPFSAQRVKGMLMVAKLLANTAPGDVPSVMSGSGDSLASRISQALSKMDQATMCQMVLTMVVYYGPSAHSTQWQVYHQAKDMLADLESLPGRDIERGLVKAFARNSNGSEERRFIESAVLEPIQQLAGFALEIMVNEFGS
ncbi:hypothetical protein F4779DRAFT_641288 [Xylariaceae sp. FL0662B]|nr:hypothetical protein F4779DRAFT_641288 [Xylariaceae sp. FL0662B]